jgi:hypothetical protein
LLGSMYKQDVRARAWVACRVHCSVPQSVTVVYIYVYRVELSRNQHYINIDDNNSHIMNPI